MVLPRIQFANLPRPVWQHLLQRVDERHISVADLLALQEWVETCPVAPEDDWYKDFGSFVLCGTDPEKLSGWSVFLSFWGPMP